MRKNLHKSEESCKEKKSSFKKRENIKADVTNRSKRMLVEEISLDLAKSGYLDKDGLRGEEKSNCK